MEYDADQEIIQGGNRKPGYIKAEQFYCFDSTALDYYVIGNITPDFLQKLFDYIQGLDEIEHITDNL